MDAGGTATTECPPYRGSEWKHESPDFSRGENQRRKLSNDAVVGFLEHYAGSSLKLPE